MWLPSLGGEDPWEKDMATHSSIPACRTTWTEEPGGYSLTLLSARTHTHTHTHKYWEECLPTDTCEGSSE